MSHEYPIRYEVTASTEWEAIDAAVRKLRTSVRLIRMEGAYNLGNRLWRVILRVSEDA